MCIFFGSASNVSFPLPEQTKTSIMHPASTLLAAQLQHGCLIFVYISSIATERSARSFARWLSISFNLGWKKLQTKLLSSFESPQLTFQRGPTLTRQGAHFERHPWQILRSTCNALPGSGTQTADLDINLFLCKWGLPSRKLCISWTASIWQFRKTKRYKSLKYLYTPCEWREKENIKNLSSLFKYLI